MSGPMFCDDCGERIESGDTVHQRQGSTGWFTSCDACWQKRRTLPPDDELDAIVDRFVETWSNGDPRSTYIDLRIEYDRDEYRRLVQCVLSAASLSRDKTT